MRQIVTLWLGNFKSVTDFNDYTNIAYTDDGDSIDSQFEEDFGIEYYDRDLVEKDWMDGYEKDLAVLLEGFSYDNQIIHQFRQSEKTYNTIILIYNYKYDGEIVKRVGENYEIELIGFAEYDSSL